MKNQTETNVLADKPAATIKTAAKAEELKAQALQPVAKAKVEQVLKQDAQRIAELSAQVVALQAQVESLSKAGDESEPVEDEDLMKAIGAIQQANKANPEKLYLSLKTELGFHPALTKEQKAKWNPVRDAIRKAHSQHWKARKPFVKAEVSKALDNPKALVGFSERVRKKDGKRTAFTFKASQLVEGLKPAKGKGKNAAKPAQPAAHVPKAGNANPPATVS